ncbi:MAG: DedA family protein [bacterium]|nr:DedA family protein [bacterium]
MLAFLHAYSALWVYFLIFSLLFLCGVGFPMAEELVLLAGGALVASGVLDPVLMLVVTFLGVLISDILLFGFGRGIASRLTTSAYFARWLSPRRLVKGAAFFAKYGNATVFLARFTPGLRAPTFLLAGSMQMGLWRFITIDTLASLVFIPLVCWSGYLFADHIDAIAAWFESLERAVVALLVVGLICWLIWRMRGRRERQVTSTHAEGN